MRRALLITAWFGFALPGCASYTALVPAQREQVVRAVTARGGEHFLRLSFFVTPFFGDASKRLLTDVPPDEVELLNDTKGQPIRPGPVEQTLVAGRAVRVLKVEFPTSWAVTERVVYTPRTQPWVYLEVPGEKTERPYILVLRQGLNSADEVQSEISRYLSQEDLAPKLAAFTAPVRDAIAKKTALTDMPQDALLMAWGYPQIRKITFEEGARKETWHYPGKRRTATVVEGRVAEFHE